ncbi:MAG: glycine cleavage system protein GcvH, partial [Deltaproteobacteria bacterium]|nr:glycine cleavage system protein GcvH [Deltaproteobacteria bacterium]
WARVENAVVVVGITSFAKDQLGDVVYLELPEVGAKVEKGQPFGVVESTKAVSELFAPISGKIFAVNADLVKNPEIVNEDPHVRGWMVEIMMSKPEELAELLDSDAYDKLTAEGH